MRSKIALRNNYSKTELEDKLWSDKNDYTKKIQELNKQVKQGIDTCKSNLGKFKDDLKKDLRSDLVEK